MKDLNFNLQRFGFTNGNDNEKNIRDSTILAALGGNDTIKNSGGNNVTIDGGAGKDSIWTDTGNSNFNHDVSIYGGAGEDAIESRYTGRITIDGGADNDSINVVGKKNAAGHISLDTTINGGTGNDTI